MFREDPIIASLPSWKIGEIKNHAYGFSCWEQMDSWVSGAVLDKVLNSDLYLAIFVTNDYLIGRSQMIFNRHTAHLVSISQITDHFRKRGIPMGSANLPGLERKYSTELANYINELPVGGSLFWRDSKWFKTGPGVEFVKQEGGVIKPVRP
jgi:hypothetical protein